MGLYEELCMDYNYIPITETNMLPAFQSGSYINGEIFIKFNLSEITKAEILFEELAHHKYTWGNILDQKDFNNRKFENYAKRAAYQNALPLDLILEAYHYGISNLFELSQYSQLSEKYILKVIDFYKTKYGLSVYYKGHVIKFEPLQVFEHNNWE